MEIDGIVGENMQDLYACQDIFLGSYVPPHQLTHKELLLVETQTTSQKPVKANSLSAKNIKFCQIFFLLFSALCSLFLTHPFSFLKQGRCLLVCLSYI